MSIITPALKKRIKRHEGMRLKPYHCPAGRLTIGIGRNLTDVGITETEAEYLLENDLQSAEKNCSDAFVWYEKLDNIRKGVIVEMVFNLGFAGFLGFRKLIKALTIGDYLTASKEMLSSRWAAQVGHRAEVLSLIMKTGKEY